MDIKVSEKIRERIGSGGKTIRSIVERTGVTIDVEGINIASSDDAAAQKAIGIIRELTATPELDKVYMGSVQRITDFGAFIEVTAWCGRPAARGNIAWPTCTRLKEGKGTSPKYHGAGDAFASSNPGYGDRDRDRGPRRDRDRGPRRRHHRRLLREGCEGRIDERDHRLREEQIRDP